MSKVKNTTTGLMGLRDIAVRNGNVTDIAIKLIDYDIFVYICFLGGYFRSKQFHYSDLFGLEAEDMDIIYDWVVETIRQVSNKINSDGRKGDDN